jgi:hypothetical protein
MPVQVLTQRNVDEYYPRDTFTSSVDVSSIRGTQDGNHAVLDFISARNLRSAQNPPKAGLPNLFYQRDC